MKDVKVGVEKMTRNHRKMMEQTGDSLLLSKHSIQLSALFLLLSAQARRKIKNKVNNVMGIIFPPVGIGLTLCTKLVKGGGEGDTIGTPDLPSSATPTNWSIDG